ncbi:MAG: hypothetical protein JNL79_13430 [Myxococcales bacterium]|nr:hypothetical protein [Myxococcales bacterium]
MSYRPCVACRRHVVVGQVGCPFCGAALAATASVPRIVGRMSRGALFTVGTSLALHGCGGTDAPPQDTGPDYGDVSIDAAYGAPDDTRTPPPPRSVEFVDDATAAEVADNLDGAAEDVAD